MNLKQVTLVDYVNNYDEYLHIDRSFNRRGVWNSSQRNAYLEALTRNRAPSVFVMVDIGRCQKFSERVGSQISVSYYSSLKEIGDDYISLDGQNRGRTIVGLLTNKNTISGSFIDADGKEVIVKNKFFKDLPQRLQDQFRTGCQVMIKIYDDVLRSELPRIFKDINAGCPLNSQEKRNATVTPIAPWVRKHSKRMNGILSNLLHKEKMDRMLDDEVVAKMAMILSRQKEWSLSSNSIDNWYELGAGFYSLKDPGIPYKSKDLARTEAIFGQFSSVWSKITNKKKFTFKMWWTILLACEWTHDHGYYIVDQVKFFNDIRKIDSDLVNHSLIQYGNDRKDLIEAGKDPDDIDISVTNYYHSYGRLPHQVVSRTRWKSALTDEIKRRKLNSIRLK